MSDPLGAGILALIKAFDPIGISIGEHQAERLERFADLLGRWTQTYNLTAVRDRGQVDRQHLADCLAILPSLRRRVMDARPSAGSIRLLDVGSGGGLPGIVIAIMEPTWEIHCIDAVGKKAAFIRQVAGELDLPNLHAHHARVESMAVPSGGFDLIVSRAFASLADFTTWSAHALARGGRWAAMKGLSPEAELASLPSSIEVIHVEPIMVPGLEAQRCLVWLAKRSE